MNSNVSELLEKINRLLRNASVADMPQVEFDLLKQHVRSLYEQLDEVRYTAHADLPVNTHVTETLQPEEIIAALTKPEEENILLNDVREEPAFFEIKQEVPVAKPEPVVSKREQPAKAEKAGSINEKIKTAESLNQKIKGPGNEVHKKLSSKPLKDLIDLNKRFVFVNQLFKGNTDAFYKAVQYVDTAPDYTAADNYIKTELVNQFEWDASSDAVQTFFKLVKQKFGV